MTQIGIPVAQQSPVQPIGWYGYGLAVINNYTLTLANTEYATANIGTGIGGNNNVDTVSHILICNNAFKFAVAAGTSNVGFPLTANQAIVIEDVVATNWYYYFQSTVAGAIVTLMVLYKLPSVTTSLGYNLNLLKT